MLKVFLKNSVVYGLGRVASVALSFITIPIITTHLSPTDYGVMDLITLCVTLLNLTVALEVSQAIARFFADSDADQRSGYTSTGLLFSMAMFAVAGLLILAFSQSISVLLFGTVQHQLLVQLMIPFFILYALQYFVTNQLRWENRALSQVSLLFLQALLFLVAVMWLVGMQHMGVKGVLYAQIFSLGCSNCLGIYWLVQHRSVRWEFDLAKLKTMLLFSFPLVPSSLAVFAQLYIDRILISRLLPIHDLGIYSFGLRIAGVLTLIISAFQMSITPLIYEHYQKSETPQQLSQAFRFFLWCVFSGCVALCLLLPELFHVLVGPEFYTAAQFIPYFMLIIILCQSYVFAPGLVIAKKTMWIALINMAGMVLNVILNLHLIPLYGLWGAVYATSLSALITALIHFSVSYKHYPIHYRAPRIVSASLVTLFAVMIIGRLWHVDIVNLSVGMLMEKLVLMLVFCATLIVLLFDRLEISLLVKWLVQKRRTLMSF